MTNSLRGAVPFEVDGASYTLRLTTNAQVRYEDAAGEDVATAINTVLKSPDKRHIKRIRRLFWVGVAPALATEDEAGEMIDALGYAKVAGLIFQALRLAVPEAPAGNAPKAAKQAAKETAESDAA